MGGDEIGKVRITLRHSVFIASKTCSTDPRDADGRSVHVLAGIEVAEIEIDVRINIGAGFVEDCLGIGRHVWIACGIPIVHIHDRDAEPNLSVIPAVHDVQIRRNLPNGIATVRLGVFKVGVDSEFNDTRIRCGTLHGGAGE